jgi:hypothetical protein
MTHSHHFRTTAITALAVATIANPALAAERCVTKAGSATGITRGFAEYESLLIIRQVTGNWPIETDRIGKPSYRCKQDGAMWTCKAVAKVCKG